LGLILTEAARNELTSKQASGEGLFLAVAAMAVSGAHPTADVYQAVSASGSSETVKPRRVEAFLGGENAGLHQNNFGVRQGMGRGWLSRRRAAEQAEHEARR